MIKIIVPIYGATEVALGRSTNRPENQNCFDKVGHLLVCKQSKRLWEPQIYYSYFVMSQLYETK
jgi:hypothetical protein